MSTKTFLQYLAESDKEYSYRIKLVVEVDDEMMQSVETLLSKYDLRDIEGPKKTIIQAHPLDFYDVKNSEVYIIDVVTGVPVSPYILQQEIRTNLQISEKFVVVRSDSDPLEVETERLRAKWEFEHEAAEKKLSPAALLSTDPAYPDEITDLTGEDMYGDEYNRSYLDLLAQVSATRDEKMHEQPETDTMFGWLKTNEETSDVDSTDFNADIEDKVSSVPWWKASKNGKYLEKTRSHQSAYGNFDEDKKRFSARYESPTGKEKTLTKDSDPIGD